MTRTALLSLLFAPLLLAGPPASAQPESKPPSPPAPSPNVTRPPARGVSGRSRVTERVAVGERAPDFELPGLDGRPVRLSSLRGNWVMLIFVERRDSLGGVEPLAQTLQPIGVRTVAVCYEKSHSLARWLRGRDVSYTPLADPTGDIVALYGLLDSAREESQPGFVLITPRGDVRLALLGHEMSGEDTSRMVQVAVQGD